MIFDDILHHSSCYCYRCFYWRASLQTQTQSIIRMPSIHPDKRPAKISSWYCIEMLPLVIPEIETRFFNLSILHIFAILHIFVILCNRYRYWYVPLHSISLPICSWLGTNWISGSFLQSVWVAHFAAVTRCSPRRTPNRATLQTLHILLITLLFVIHLVIPRIMLLVFLFLETSDDLDPVRIRFFNEELFLKLPWNFSNSLKIHRDRFSNYISFLTKISHIMLNFVPHIIVTKYRSITSKSSDVDL